MESVVLLCAHRHTTYGLTARYCVGIPSREGQARKRKGALAGPFVASGKAQAALASLEAVTGLLRKATPIRLKALISAIAVERSASSLSLNSVAAAS